jgi:uncharacterized membrane protein
MEAMLILVFLVFVILLLAATSKSQRHLFDIHSELGGLRDDLREFLTQSRLEIRQLRAAPVLPSPLPAQAAPPPPAPTPEPPQPKPAPVPTPPAPKPELRPSPLPELPKPKPAPLPELPKPEPLPAPVPTLEPEPESPDKRVPTPKPEEPKPLAALPLNKAPLPVPNPPVSMRHSDRPQAPVPEPVRTPPPPPPPPMPPEEPRPGFFERHRDLEKFIGENLISKIGIAILVIGIGFFVKYAIDQNWIRPAGRVAIGMLCGGILIGLAHRLQKAYKAFSSVLVGGGLAVCYYTIALGYQDYGLMSQPVAFGIMAALTAFAAVLSLLYDRQEVAIIAMAGGFTAPFLVSNGSGNYAVLFSYLLLLNTGLLIIAYRKAWRLLNGLAFGLTTILFGGWLATLDAGTAARVYRGGFFFAAAFYLLFLAINLAHNVSRRKTFIVSDFSILLATTGLFFGGGVYMLEQGGWSGGKGIFAIALAVLNFGLTSFLVRRGRVDKSILYLFIGITLSFVSMAAPLQLSGHSITLFWAAETVVLLWLYMRTRYSILRIGFCIVWVAAWISLLMDWNLYFFSIDKFPVVLNRGFLTSMYVAAAHVVMYTLCRRQTRNPGVMQAPVYVAPLAGTLAIVLCYITGYTEIWLQFSARASNHYVLTQYLLGYSLAFVVALDLLRKRAVPGLKSALMMVFLGIGILAYLACCVNVYHVQLSLWQSYGRFSHFGVHWIAAALALYMSLRLLKMLREGPLKEASAGLNVAAAVFGLLFVSVETGMLIRVLVAGDLSQIHTIDDNYVRIGLPIVWGVYSFFLMWQGMRHRDKVLRITSLSIFSITLLKLFLVDIRMLGPGGKIAAFCSLGVLLLVVSFMYQRLRRLLIADKPHGENEADPE